MSDLSVKNVKNVKNVESVEAAVIAAIRRLLPEPVDEISPVAALDDLGMDSMTLMDLVLELEDEFRVTFPDNALMRIRAVRDVLDLTPNERA